jgi:hypothetical protein
MLEDQACPATCMLVIVVVIGETKLDRKVFAVIDGVKFSKEEVSGDEKRATGFRNVQSDDSGDTTSAQVHDVILAIQGIAIAIDNV